MLHNRERPYGKRHFDDLARSPSVRHFSKNKGSVGFSLIEVMNALGVMSVGVMGFMTMLDSQLKSSKALSEKLAALDLQNILSQALATGGICNFILMNPSQAGNRSPNPPVFDSTNASAAIQFQQIPASPSATAPLIAQVGKQASPVANSLYINSISIGNMVGSGSSFTATLQVAFDLSKIVRPVRAASSALILQTDPTSPPGAKKVIGCTNGTIMGVDTTSLNHSNKNSLSADCVIAGNSGCTSAMANLTANHGCFYLRNDAGGGYPSGGQYDNYQHDEWMACPRGMYAVGTTDDNPGQIDFFCCPFIDPNPTLP